MSTITKELAKLFRKITNSEIDAEGNAHVVLSPADSLLINNARIALASLEAEPVAWLLSGGGAKNNVSFDSGNAYADPLREVTPLYTAPPAPVSVPAAMEIDDDFDSAFEHGKAVGWNAYRAAMLQAEPVSNSDELPLDYLQGHKDGLEWAAQLSESNHPETGDWLYDDPIELAKAIRKGPDMPPAQPVADSEPVVVVGDDGGDALSYRRLIQSFEPGTKLYRHAQPAPVVPPMQHWEELCRQYPDMSIRDAIIRAAWWNHCRAAMLQAGNSPVIPGRWIPVSERLPEDSGRYWCYVEEQNDLGKSHYQWNYSWNGDRWWVESEGGGIVTHWMPLPAAPREVK